MKRRCHKNARAFHGKILDEYTLTEGDKLFLEGVINALSTYWHASDQLAVEGYTVGGEEGGMLRKHPAVEVAKISWAQFISGAKLLGLCVPEPDPKRPYGKGP